MAKKVHSFINIALFLIVVSLSYAATAGGGKVKAENPIVDEDGNPIGTVINYDAEACQVTVPDQAGQNFYVVCDTEE